MMKSNPVRRRRGATLAEHPPLLAPEDFGAKRPAAPKRKRRRVAETEGFEPSIGLYNPITV